MDWDGDASALRLRGSLDIDEGVLADIRAARTVLGPQLPTLVDAFYEWLPALPDFDSLLRDPARIERLKREQLRYWSEFLDADADEAYAAKRRAVGAVHARIGLGPLAYLRSMRFVSRWFTAALASAQPALRASTPGSLAKLIEFDTALVLQAYEAAVAGAMHDLQQRAERGDRLQEELLHGRKMEAVGRLASGVAHDLNNLLAGIIGVANIAASRADAGTPVAEPIEMIRSAAERGTQSVRHLLDFACKREVELCSLHFDHSLRRSEGLLTGMIGERIALEVDLAADGAHVRADAGYLDQVLLNLVVNAADAMPDGGVLTVSSRRSPLGVSLTVHDTGIGMSEEVQAKIFEPFFTTKPRGAGTGLGLANVYGIIAALGGHIEIESAPGDGSRFTVLLPEVAAPGGTIAGSAGS